MPDEEFRADIRAAIRRHDPDAEQLRALARSREDTASKWEIAEDEI